MDDYEGFYKDNKRKGFYMLSLRLRKGKHDFILDNWSALVQKSKAESPDTKSGIGQNILHMLLEFYLSNATSATSVNEPIEVLRRRVDDNTDVIMTALSELSDRLENVSLVGNGQVENLSIGGSDVPDDLLESMISDHYDVRRDDNDDN